MGGSKKHQVKRAGHVFSLEQKQFIVQEIESEKLSRHEALKKYNIASMKTLNNWLIERGASKDKLIGKYFPKAVQRQSAYRVIMGEATVEQITSELRIGPSRIKMWIGKFKEEIVQERKKRGKGKFSSQSSKKEPKEVEELKLRIAALEMMIDIAERDLGIDIRKKSGTKQ